jgi:hypothetical protein
MNLLQPFYICLAASPNGGMQNMYRKEMKKNEDF